VTTENMILAQQNLDILDSNQCGKLLVI